MLFFLTVERRPPPHPTLPPLCLQVNSFNKHSDINITHIFIVWGHPALQIVWARLRGLNLKKRRKKRQHHVAWVIHIRVHFWVFFFSIETLSLKERHLTFLQISHNVSVFVKTAHIHLIASDLSLGLSHFPLRSVDCKSNQGIRPYAVVCGVFRCVCAQCVCRSKCCL